MSDQITPPWRVVAEREITTRLRDKTFLVMSGILLLSVVATIVITTVVSGRDRHLEVVVVDPVGSAAAESAVDIASAIDEHAKMTVLQVADPGAARLAVEDGDAEAALLPTSTGYEVVGDDDVDDTVSQALKVAVGREVLQQNARSQGVDLDALQRGSTVSEHLLEPKPDDQEVRRLVSFVFVLLFYVTALGFGMTIAQSVTQEKESRIVEILAAAVPVRSLLWGKIVGNSLLAIGQVLLLVGTGVVALLLTGNAHVLTVVGGAMVWYLVFFVLGFGALACLWSVAGALASRQQDLQATTTPGQVLLFAPYILAVVAGEGVKTVVSMLPIVSAMMMPSRMAEGPVPAWQIAVAIATTIVAAVLLVRVGVRAFEHTVLRTGRRIGYREALAGVRDG